MTSETDIKFLQLGDVADFHVVGAETAIPVRDKFTDRPIVDVPVAQDVVEVVDGLHAATLMEAPVPSERATVLRRTAAILDEQRDRFARLLTAEAGFTLNDSQGEIDRALVTLELCAQETSRLNGETVDFSSSPSHTKRLGFTMRMPIGVVCAITPFNSPLNTVLHKVGPALAAGNPVVLKPSELTPLTAAALYEIMIEAGQPPDRLAIVYGEASVGRALLAHPDIAFYAFTGSTSVGAEVALAAGIRGSQLELGSIASTIVCADADLDRAVPKIANAGFRKAGQVCTSVQRLYVQEAVYDEVVAALVLQASALIAGDPRDPKVRVGPLISRAAAERVERWISEALADGAELACGGDRSGSVISPTVLTGSKGGMKVLDEEVFGPVVSVLPFTEVDAAIEAANDTPYGLAAGIFTTDIDQGLRAARQLQFGSVHLNETSSSRADAMPFGGIKASGRGLEGPSYAVHEMTTGRLVTFNP